MIEIIVFLVISNIYSCYLYWRTRIKTERLEDFLKELTATMLKNGSWTIIHKDGTKDRVHFKCSKQNKCK